MPHLKLIPVLLITLSVILISCNDDPSTIGSGLLGDDLIEVKILDSATDQINQSSGYFKSPLKIGNEEYLFLGRAKNLTAYILIRFGFILPDSIKNDLANDLLQVTSANVEFLRYYAIGDTSTQFQVSVHEVRSGWTSVDFTADSIPLLDYNPANAASNMLLTDSIFSFDLQPQLVQEWMKLRSGSNPTIDNGIFIKPDALTERAIGFFALNLDLINLPKINVVVTKSGSYTDTLSFNVTEDISVIEGDLPVISSENIAVQSGLAVYGTLYFDLSSLPDGALVNSAELVMTKDTLETLLGQGFNDRITAFMMTDSTQKSVDNSRRVDLSPSGNEYKGDVTRIVQYWQKNKFNQGILLRPTVEVRGLELFVLKGSNAQDQLLRPRLRITYTGKK